jgi:Tfp pilus assembly protein PilF
LETRNVIGSEEQGRSGEKARQDVAAVLREGEEHFGEAMKFMQNGHRDLAKDELSRVVSACGQAIRIDPRHAAAYQLRARAYEHLGQDDEAERDLARARALGTRDA